MSRDRLSGIEPNTDRNADNGCTDRFGDRNRAETVRCALLRDGGHILYRVATPVQRAAIEGYSSANALVAYELACYLSYAFY